ncbi:lef4 protein [Gynaephora ruoergensis nucleopolyhedrovirus]|nr:lef4 protein [Gynaephora ruoergensis nucleopolyhedrovirus]
MAFKSSSIEKEISYSINLSQDLLYIILSSYIFKKFIKTQEYVDCVDENNVRNRMVKGGNFESTIKTTQSVRKFVHAHENTLVPLVDRISVEEVVERDRASPRLKKISTCQVWKPRDCFEIEIKYEKIYFNQNIGDTFDSLMAQKLVTLLNCLQNKQEKITANSHLGSDEILICLRLEYEYENDSPEPLVLDYLVNLVREMDAFSHYRNISPLLPYTTLSNNIIYRKFQDEKLIYGPLPNDSEERNICKWALKLDGLRGKGLITRGFITIFVDDMQLFSGRLPWMFSVNNVVAFQCELMNDSIVYITDLMHVFKYTYNNKTQYECSLDGYDIDPLSAVECLNYLNATTNSEGLRLCENSSMIGNENNKILMIKFQKFLDPPMSVNGYSTLATDGFVVLDCNMRYVKYKYSRTLELEYDAKEKSFCDLYGPVENYRIVNENGVLLEHKKIYEVIADTRNNVVTVIKFRPDRLVPQLLV